MKPLLPVELKLTPTEKSILEHRLDALQDGGLEDIYEDDDTFDLKAGLAFVDGALDTFRAGGKALMVDTPAAVEVIVECLEGSTWCGCLTGNVKSPDMRSAQRKMKAFARRLEALFNCEIAEMTS